MRSPATNWTRTRSRWRICWSTRRCRFRSDDGNELTVRSAFKSAGCTGGSAATMRSVRAVWVNIFKRGSRWDRSRSNALATAAIRRWIAMRSRSVWNRNTKRSTTICCEWTTIWASWLAPARTATICTSWRITLSWRRCGSIGRRIQRCPGRSRDFILVVIQFSCSFYRMTIVIQSSCLV